MRLQEEQPADLVITDIFMPEMDGLELIQELRHSEGLKVIAMSGRRLHQENPSAYQLVAARAAGAWDTLAKPFDIQMLAAAIHRALPDQALYMPEHDRAARTHRMPRASSARQACCID
jgi:CheY-like chemotaxis protein